MATSTPSPLRAPRTVSERRVSTRRPAYTEPEALADVAELSPVNEEGPDLEAMYAAMQADRDAEAVLAARECEHGYVMEAPDYAYLDEMADLEREQILDSGRGC